MAHLGGVAMITGVQLISPARASVVAANGAIKNLGKLLAPVLLGLSTLVAPLSVGFAVVAGILVASASAARPLRTHDSRISKGGL